MRRPRLSHGDRQETALLDATERLLERELPSRLTIGAIAREADLSRPAVYFYFDNKDAIITATVDRVVEQLVAQHANPTPQDGFVVSVDDLLRYLFELWRAKPHLLSGIMELTTTDSAYRRVWHEYMDRGVDMFLGLVEHERARGALSPPEDVRSALLALYWMIERSCYMLFSREHTDADERELFDTLRSVTYRTLGVTGNVASDSE